MDRFETDEAMLVRSPTVAPAFTKELVMLSIKRHLGESIEVGTARISLVGWSNKNLDLLIVRGTAVQRVQIREGYDEDLKIDGGDVMIGFETSRFGPGTRKQFKMHISAPREIVILRSEVADEIKRKKNGQSIKGLAYVE
jgi:hypothetical protein